MLIPEGPGHHPAGQQLQVFCLWGTLSAATRAELDGYPGISCSLPWEGQSRQSWGQPGGTHGNTAAGGTQFRTGGAFPALPGPAVLWAHWSVLSCLSVLWQPVWLTFMRNPGLWSAGSSWFPWKSRDSPSSHRGGQCKAVCQDNVLWPRSGVSCPHMNRRGASTEPNLGNPPRF